MNVKALLLVCIAAALFAVGCGDSSSDSTGGSPSAAGGSGDPVRVAFVFAGSARDGGWSESFDRSRAAIQKEFGDEVETTYKENVPEGPQVRPVIESLVRDGWNLIVGSGYGYGESMIAAARRYPDVHFLQSQWTSPGLDNFSGFDNAPEDGAYVAGVAIGELIDDGAEVGWVDAFPIPYDLRTIDGFALGLNRSNPTATVNVVMTNSWTDTNKMGQAAGSLASAGAAALSGSISGPPVGEVAERSSLPYVSISVDGRKFAPKMTVTSTVYNWVPVFRPAVQALIDGEWESEFYYVGMPDGAIEMTPFTGPFDQLDAAQKKAVEAAHEEIKSGDRSVFQGPLRDNAGKVVVPAGETLTPDQLEALNFTVPNVKGVKVESGG
jgi:basic membrane protein A and related proteins